MIAEGFSPNPDDFSAGDLKALFAAWQQARAQGTAAE
jgi:hypothetical protein